MPESRLQVMVCTSPPCVSSKRPTMSFSTTSENVLPEPSSPSHTHSTRRTFESLSNARERVFLSVHVAV
eukprot:3935102-Rhodomonas_salina.1